MVGCSILGCKRRSERKIDGITFHSVPSGPEIKQKWLDATGRQNWQPTKHAICSIHFNEDLFLYKEKSKHLKPYSIPLKDIHIANSAEQMLDNVTLTQPSTGKKSLDEPGAVGVKRRTDLVLQEIQNIQTKKLCLDPCVTIQDVSEQSGYKNTLPIVSTPKKKKQLKLQLRKEKMKSANRLKKLRAVRESKRRLLKKLLV